MGGAGAATGGGGTGATVAGSARAGNADSSRVVADESFVFGVS